MEGVKFMDTFGWDEMASWWDEKQGDEGDLWHRALIDPPSTLMVFSHLTGRWYGCRGI